MCMFTLLIIFIIICIFVLGIASYRIIKFDDFITIKDLMYTIVLLISIIFGIICLCIPSLVNIFWLYVILSSIISGILDSFDLKFLYKEIFTIRKTIKWILQIVNINVYLLQQKLENEINYEQQKI